jgi:hypothetical protein
MIEPAVVAAAGVVAGAVVAVAARDRRVVAIGLLVAMVSAPLVASPLPESLSVAARVVGAVLAAYLLWAASRGLRSDSSGSALGLAAEIAIAVAAFAIGMSVSMVDPLPGPTVAQAAGLALVALAVVPLVGRDVLRLGVGVVLLVLGSTLFTAAWLGPTPPLAHLAIAALLTGIVGATSVTLGRQPLIEAAPVDEPAVSATAPSLDAPRPRPSRSRERLKSPSDQTTVWAQAEPSMDQAAAEAPAFEASPSHTAGPAPAGRLRRPPRSAKS